MLHFPIWNRGRRFVPIHPSSARSLGDLRVGVLACALGLFAARRGSDVPFWVSRRHVVVFSVRMRKIFPFGVPRGALTVHGAPSKLSPICKSPGRPLRVSGERGSAPFQPAPNGNILRIRARFPTRWPSLVHFTQGDSLYSPRPLGNGRSLPPEASFRIWGAGSLAKGGVVCQQGDGGAVLPGCAAS